MPTIKQVKPSTHINLNGKEYPVIVERAGNIPCLCIGIGSLMQITLSSQFKEQFTLYSTDLYWIKQDALEDPQSISMDSIIDDIFSIISELNLDKPIVLAHSAYGIVALEAAKRKDANIGGVIMVGSPTESSPRVAKIANEFFEANASKERKSNDKARKDHYEKIKKPDESEISINAYESATARYWKDFNITREFLEKLWQNIECDDAIMNRFFSEILPKHDLSQSMEKVHVPVLLAGGSNDYDCIPLELWKDFPKPKNFTLVDCGTAGHWPQFEARELFDLGVKSWLKNI